MGEDMPAREVVLPGIDPDIATPVLSLDPEAIAENVGATVGISNRELSVDETISAFVTLQGMELTELDETSRAELIVFCSDVLGKLGIGIHPLEGNS